MDTNYYAIYQTWLRKDVADKNNVFTIHAETYRLPLKLAEIISHSEAELVEAEISNEAKNLKLFLEIMPAKGEKGLKKLMELLEANGDEKLLCYLRCVQGLGDPQQEIWGNIPIENRCFVGRESTTELIKAKFDEGANKTSRVIVVVCGLGGVGKTQIAADFVHKTESSYKRQVWITASEARCESSFMKLAQELNFTEKAVKANIERVKDWFEKRVPCLIVFDDAENYDQIAAYLPKSGCHILVTSRYTVWPKITVAECIHLKVFTKEESALFVEKMLQDDETPLDANEVNDLSHLLGYLPLALAQACSYVRECLSSISDYIVLFNSQKQIELLRAQKLPKDMQNDENENTIMVTWNITQAAIQRRSPLATALLHGCLCFQLDSIPIFLTTTFFFLFHESSIVFGTDEISSFSIDELLSKYFSLECHKEYFIEYSAAMKILTSFAMLTSNIHSEYTMHCLLQKVIKIQKSIEEGGNHYVFEKDRLILHSIILGLAFDYPAADPSKLSKKFRSLLPHVLEHIRTIESYNRINSNRIIDPRIVEQQKEIASLISSEFGLFEQARTLFEEILKSKQARCLHDDYEIAPTVLQLGSVCFILGDTKKAQQCFQRALVIQEKKLDADYPKIASTLVQLAKTFCHIGDIERSSELFERAIKMQMNHPHLANPEQFADCLLGLAKLMNSREEYSKEKDLLEKAMPFFETVKGVGYSWRGVIWAELGCVNFKLGNVQAAKVLLEKGLNILNEYFENEDHPSLPAILSILGLVYLQLGDQTKAKESFEKALTMVKKFVPSDSLDIAAILMNLVIVNIKFHQLVKAIELCEKAVSITEKHGSSNMLTAKLLFLLGHLYLKVGEDKSCEEIIEKHRKIVVAHFLNHISQSEREVLMDADSYKTIVLEIYKEGNLLDDFNSNLEAKFTTTSLEEQLQRRKPQDRKNDSASQFGYIKITRNLENLFCELNKTYSFEKYLLFDKFIRTSLIRLEEANNSLKIASLKITDSQITNLYSLLKEVLVKMAKKSSAMNDDIIASESIIGSGSSAKVHRGMYKGQHVAVKKFISYSEKLARELKEEFAIIKELKHPNIITYIAYKDNSFNQQLLLAMELVDGHTLGFLSSKRHSKISLETKLPIAICCWNGLQYLHDNKICHGDISPNNILISHDLTITKFCDFGFAKFKLKMKTTNTTLGVGTLMYKPPELYKRRRHPAKSDIYSLAVTLCEFFSESDFWEVEHNDDFIPIWFRQLSSITESNVSVPEPDCFQNLLPLLQDILRDAVHPNHQNRPTALELSEATSSALERLIEHGNLLAAN